MNKDTYNAALQHRSFDCMSGILSWMGRLTKSVYPEFSFENKSALEIGSGKFLVNSLAMYVCGCSEVVSIDKYKQLEIDAMKVAMSNPILARRFLSDFVNHDDYVKRLTSINKTNFEINELKRLGINYIAPFSDSDYEALHHRFDIVYSYTVLEHVIPNEIYDLIEQSILCLNDKGVCIHFVDLEDHKDPVNNPFEFLSLTSEWNEEKSFHRGNGMRFSEWKSILEKFSNMKWDFPFVVNRNDADIPEKIRDDIFYVNEVDLRTTAFVAIGRKI